MGEFVYQMFRIFAILFLLIARLCDCFPHLNDNKLRGDLNLKPMSRAEYTIGDRQGNLTSDVVKKHDETYSGKFNIGPFGALVLKSTETVFQKIRNFTEMSVLVIMKNYHNDSKTVAKENAGIPGTGRNEGNSSNVIRANKTSMKNAARISESSDNNKEISVYEDVEKNTKTMKAKAPGKSKIDRWLLGFRRYRRKRSYYADLGLDLESAFADDDTTDIVYGAHTSPCDKADRHYCLNGGTCVFVGALEIKTCRCRIGYKGLRCESLNQDFLLALLSEGLFI